MLYRRIIFAQRLFVMTTSSARVQTAFRLDTVLLEQMRRQAKAMHKTLNSHVESILLQAVSPELPSVPVDYQVSEETLGLCGFIPQPSPEQLKNDPKLAYILGK